MTVDSWQLTVDKVIVHLSEARVIATMCGGVIPAWAMPDDDKEENTNEKNAD